MWDIFNICNSARSLGDCLVVALNDDSSVRLLKGEKRPLISHDERARILAALECVDYVTVFGDETPLILIRHLRPDIFDQRRQLQRGDRCGGE